MEHPNLVAIEAEREAIFARLKAAQDELAVEAGCYLQCLLTPDVEADGVELVAFNRYRQAGDEKRNWAAVLGAADVDQGVRCQYAVDRYDGPRGSGFILCCRVVYGGRVWLYQEHHGPELERDSSQWLEVADGE